jgi:signal transduction histidine kinase
VNVAKHILVVEDEGVVALDIKRTLTDYGYEIGETAATADQAIRLASEWCPDLVLMDIRIKGDRDGIETAKILRSRFGVPVIYLTANADEPTTRRAMSTEPLAYLVKPVKPLALRGAVELGLCRHEAEKNLRQKDQWFSTTLGEVAEAVVMVDLGGHITFMNLAAETLTGWAACDAIGKVATDVLPPRGLARSINNSAATVVDGTERLGTVIVFNDLSETRMLRQQLEFADRLTSLGIMAAGVMHDLSNPLAIMITNAGLMAEDLKTLIVDRGVTVSPATLEHRLEEMGHVVGDIQAAGSHMRRIVADMRAFSQPPEPTDAVLDFVRGVNWAVRMTAHEFQHRARVVTHFGETPVVMADESRLGQVLINILVNAAQAMPPGNADQNEVNVTTSTAEDGRAAIDIQDTGAGIPEGNLTRIFEPFFTTKPAGIGTGLGLSISQGIVRSFGGELQVHSEVGKGTTIRVLLPAASGRRDRRRND